MSKMSDADEVLLFSARIDQLTEQRDALIKDLARSEEKRDRVRSFLLNKVDCECGFEEELGEGYTAGICFRCLALAEDSK